MQNSQSYRMVVLDLRFGQILMKIFNFKVKVSLIVSATVRSFLALELRFLQRKNGFYELQIIIQNSQGILNFNPDTLTYLQK